MSMIIIKGYGSKKQHRKNNMKMTCVCARHFFLITINEVIVSVVRFVYGSCQ
jgi:hypothetical protein